MSNSQTAATKPVASAESPLWYFGPRPNCDIGPLRVHLILNRATEFPFQPHQPDVTAFCESSKAKRFRELCGEIAAAQTAVAASSDRFSKLEAKLTQAITIGGDQVIADARQRLADAVTARDKARESLAQIRTAAVQLESELRDEYRRLDTESRKSHAIATAEAEEVVKREIAAVLSPLLDRLAEADMRLKTASSLPSFESIVGRLPSGPATVPPPAHESLKPLPAGVGGFGQPAVGVA